MNENKVKVWLARDKSGSLRLYTQKTKKEINGWTSNSSSLLIYMYSFPSVKWEDSEPTEAYITLAKPQEQPKPKQEIDWEQRRYEIAKEMLPIIYWQGMEAQKHGQSVKRKDTADFAVAFADVLIKKLKEKSE